MPPSRRPSASSSEPTRMSPPEAFALREYLGPELKGRTISDARHNVSLTDILRHSCLIGRSRELSGRSVLLAASGQLQSALAMIELDGVARRMLLCPPDLDPDRIQALLADAEIDAIVTDRPDRCDDGSAPGRRRRPARTCGRGMEDRTRDRVADADLGHIRAAQDRRTYARLGWPAQSSPTGLRATRTRPGRRSTTSAATAACRYSCAR